VTLTSFGAPWQEAIVCVAFACVVGMIAISLTIIAFGILAQLARHAVR
jgi:hypothetical protein